jgi:hypothetical protein
MRTWTMVLAAALMPVVAAGAADWQPLGNNANGNAVFVDRASVKKSGAITTVAYRTVLKTPLDTVGGGITSLRSLMQVNCKDRTAAGIEVVLYEDEAKGRVFARNKAPKIEYLKEPAGGSADLVIQRVCAP